MEQTVQELFVFGVPVRVAGTVTDIVIVLSGNLILVFLILLAPKRYKQAIFIILSDVFGKIPHSIYYFIYNWLGVFI